MHERRTIAKSRSDRTKSPALRWKLVAWSFLGFVGAGLCMLTPLFAQDTQATLARPQGYYKVVPLTGVSAAAMAASVAGATTIPMWRYNITASRDGHPYTGVMVGRSPFFHGARTTNVPTFIIPLKVHMPDGGVFDPTATDSSCSPSGTPLNLFQNSPIITPVDISMGGVDIGTAQYVDAFQRASFWSDVSVTGTRYHSALGPITTLAVQTWNVPSGKGATYNATTYRGCGKIGVVDFSTMDNFVTGTLMPALAGSGVGPTNFPIILLYNVVMGDPGDSISSNCCILGYHGAGGFPAQTYSPMDYDTTGIFGGVGNTSVAAHEVGEWMDDPLGTNPTPPWGNIGQVTGCQSNLEVGDPLSETNFPPVLMPNNVTYELQELASFSWFFSTPSLGVNGWFSDNGTFTNDAAVCH
jgi:hypothetical protein